MKKFTAKEIKEIRENLENGYTYCGISNNYGTGCIYITQFGNIAYEHYGSSAIGNTNKNLKWLLEVIFHDCDTIVPAEWSEYHINYIPIDKKYNGFDCSYTHPNVYGL